MTLGKVKYDKTGHDCAKVVFILHPIPRQTAIDSSCTNFDLDLLSKSLHFQVETVAARFPSASELPSKPLDGLKVGVIEECMGPGLSESVRATAEATCRHLESLGASIGNVKLPNFSAGLPAYYIIATSEASSNLSRYATLD